jgi:glycosyltransferase involved in cell wall biosynthesis
MKKTPFFSVLVPVYNVEGFIVECLDSLAKQTFTDFEIVIVNDNSLDKSEELINEFLKNNKEFSSKVVYHKNNKNKGIAEVRNISVDLAKGKYICFVDGDDFVTPNFLDSFYQYTKGETIDVAFTSSIYVYEDGQSKVKKIVKGLEGVLTKKDNLHTYFETISQFFPDYLVTRAFRKELFKNIKFPIGCNYEDVLMLPMIMFNSESLYVFNTPTYYYRQQATSITHKYSDRTIPLMSEINNLYPKWKELGLLKFYYLRYAKNIRDQFYGIIRWAPDKKTSLNVLRIWSKQLKWRFIFGLIRYGQKGHLLVYIPLKLSPHLTYFMYKTWYNKKYSNHKKGSNIN